MSQAFLCLKVVKLSLTDRRFTYWECVMCWKFSPCAIKMATQFLNQVTLCTNWRSAFKLIGQIKVETLSLLCLFSARMESNHTIGGFVLSLYTYQVGVSQDHSIQCTR
mmetsp:Transcript_16281/g.27932  ORF Transcript_16281/g.27932 Transcript_16281/m.27932 type:complete len:108 (+) Transcript_16281:1083-1406(+)